ncbi:MAG TPA: biopolymer transporter ExbD [Gemmatimonadaceae bacterium]|jgi:biopolymer transport protein ExbD
MPSRFHKLRARQQEREPLTAHGRINLVPLVDILTSIVFFSLLTYTGAVMTNLTAFDLALPPVVVTAPGTTSGAQPDTTTLILAVGIKQGGLRIEHSNGGAAPWSQNIAGVTTASLDTLQEVLQAIKAQFPDNDAVMVVPDDDVAYDDIVHVLERVKLAKYPKISLSSTARSMQVATVNTGGR